MVKNCEMEERYAYGQCEKVQKWREVQRELKKYRQLEQENETLLALMEKNRKKREQMERWMSTVDGEDYGKIVPLKFMENRTEEEIAEMLFCDISTIRRQKKKILEKMYRLIPEEV